MSYHVNRCVLLTSDVFHRVLQVTGSVTSCYTLCNVSFKPFSLLCVTGTCCFTSTARSSQLSANQNYLQPFLSVVLQVTGYVK